MAINTSYRKHWISFLSSYSQIFFSDSRILGSLLLIVSFMDYWSGLFGALSVIVSLFFAHRLGFNKEQTEDGVFTYNSLLVGLGIGLYFEPSLSLLLFTFVVSMMVLLLSVGISWTKFWLLRRPSEHCCFHCSLYPIIIVAILF